MNTFNRVLIIILGLLLIAGSCMVLVAMSGVPSASFANAPWFSDRLAPLTQLSGTSHLTAVIVSIGALVLALLLIVVEILGRSRTSSVITLLNDGGGRVTATPQLVRELAEREALAVPGVVNCRLAIHMESGALALSGKLAVERDASLLGVTREVRDQLRMSLERDLGQPLKEVRLRCTVAKARRRWRTSGSWQRGDYAVLIELYNLIERSGPVLATLAAALAIIVGVLIIVVPGLLAWLVGIALVLAGIGVLVALLTLHQEQRTAATTSGPLSEQQRAGSE